MYGGSLLVCTNIHLGLFTPCLPGAIVSANWRSRTEIVDYCVSVLDSELTRREKELNTILDFSSDSSNPAHLSPSQQRRDRWRGPTNDFYRVSREPGTLSPLTGAAPENKNRLEDMTIEERQEFERRQREKENDAKSSLWEDRVKVGMFSSYPRAQRLYPF